MFKIKRCQSIINWNTLIVFILLIFSGCTKKGTAVKDSIIVAGEIQDPVAEFPFLKCYYNGFKTTKEAFDQDGKFKFETKSSEPNFYYLQIDNQTVELFLKPGDSIFVSANAKDFVRTAAFSGGVETEQNFLKQWDTFKQKTSISARELFASQVDKFIRQTDSIKESQEYFYQEFKNNTTEMHPSFIHVMDAEILYQWAKSRANYNTYHASITKKEFVKPTKEYENYKNQLNLSDPEILVSSNYVSYLHLILKQRMQKTWDQASCLEKLKEVTNSFTQADIQDKIMYDLIDQQLWTNSMDQEDAVAFFRENCSNSDLTRKLIDEYELFQNIHPGKLAPEVAFTDTAGNSYKTSDFRGKYLYIDIWASWCAPCLEEIPLLKDLKKKYDGTQLSIISISVDDSQKDWRAAMIKSELKDKQYLATGGWNSALINKFRIQTIPRFLFVNPEGVIVNSQAKLPSQGIEEEFELLNLQMQSQL